MKPVALTISVNYSDKLPYIIKNIQHLKAWYFVVERRDEATISFLQKQNDPNIHLLFYDAFFTSVSRFNKSGALRYGQTLLHEKYPHEWIVVLDSDIVLPQKFSVLLHKVVLNPECLYGCKRFDYRSKADLMMGNGIPYATDKIFHFVGYFQMYFRKDALYPETSVNCGECDMDFLETYFPKDKRYLIPHANVKHLGIPAINWNGRKEPLW